MPYSRQGPRTHESVSRNVGYERLSTPRWLFSS